MAHPQHFHVRVHTTSARTNSPDYNTGIPSSYALHPRIPLIQRQPTPRTTDLTQRALTVHIAIRARGIPAHASQQIAHPALAAILDTSPRILALPHLCQTRLDAHAIARQHAGQRVRVAGVDDVVVVRVIARRLHDRRVVAGLGGIRGFVHLQPVAGAAEGRLVAGACHVAVGSLGGEDGGWGRVGAAVAFRAVFDAELGVLCAVGYAEGGCYRGAVGG